MWTIIGTCIAIIVGLKFAQVVLREIVPERWADAIDELYHWTKCFVIGYYAGTLASMSDDTKIGANDWQMIGIGLAWVYHRLDWNNKLLTDRVNVLSGGTYGE